MKSYLWSDNDWRDQKYYINIIDVKQKICIVNKDFESQRNVCYRLVYGFKSITAALYKPKSFTYSNDVFP